MPTQIIQYMTVAVTVHALLVSVGALVGVNTARKLSDQEQEAWNAQTERQKARDLSPIPGTTGTWEAWDAVESSTSKLMKWNLTFGFPGIFYSLITIALNPENLPTNSYTELIIASLALVLFQAITFILLTARGMAILSTVRKVMSSDTPLSR